jgi:hypothetical protein
LREREREKEREKNARFRRGKKRFKREREKEREKEREEEREPPRRDIPYAADPKIPNTVMESLSASSYPGIRLRSRAALYAGATNTRMKYTNHPQRISIRTVTFVTPRSECGGGRESRRMRRARLHTVPQKEKKTKKTKANRRTMGGKVPPGSPVQLPPCCVTPTVEASPSILHPSSSSENTKCKHTLSIMPAEVTTLLSSRDSSACDFIR